MNAGLDPMKSKVDHFFPGRLDFAAPDPARLNLIIGPLPSTRPGQSVDSSRLLCCNALSNHRHAVRPPTDRINIRLDL